MTKRIIFPKTSLLTLLAFPLLMGTAFSQSMTGYWAKPKSDGEYYYEQYRIQGNTGFLCILPGKRSYSFKIENGKTISEGLIDSVSKVLELSGSNKLVNKFTEKGVTTSIEYSRITQEQSEKACIEEEKEWNEWIKSTQSLPTVFEGFWKEKNVEDPSDQVYLKIRDGEGYFCSLDEKSSFNFRIKNGFVTSPMNGRNPISKISKDSLLISGEEKGDEYSTLFSKIDVKEYPASCMTKEQASISAALINKQKSTPISNVHKIRSVKSPVDLRGGKTLPKLLGRSFER